MPLRADKNFREVQEMILLKSKAADTTIKEVKDEVLGTKKGQQDSSGLRNEQTIVSQARHFTRLGKLETGFMYINKALVFGDEDDLPTKMILERYTRHTNIYRFNF